MSESGRIPAEAFHPSVFIKEEMRARRWSKAKLALRMGADDPATNYLALDIYFVVGPQRRGCRLGKKMAAQLGRAFDVTPQYFLNLEKAWLAHQPPPHPNTGG